MTNESNTDDLRKRDHHKHPTGWGPYLLVGLGIVLLLNNFGVIRWNIWASLFQAWPLVLIFIGLKMISKKSEEGNNG